MPKAAVCPGRRKHRKPGHEEQSKNSYYWAAYRMVFVNELKVNELKVNELKVNELKLIEQICPLI
ncbi:MAG: hypothetical protein WD317_00865 [Balneolaceae bacterium]